MTSSTSSVSPTSLGSWTDERTVDAPAHSRLWLHCQTAWFAWEQDEQRVGKEEGGASLPTSLSPAPALSIASSPRAPFSPVLPSLTPRADTGSPAENPSVPREHSLQTRQIKLRWYSPREIYSDFSINLQKRVPIIFKKRTTIKSETLGVELKPWAFKSSPGDQRLAVLGTTHQGE